MQAPAVHPQEAVRLALLHELELLDTAPEPEFDAVTRLVRQALGTPITLLSMVDAQRQWFKSRQGEIGHETPRDLSFCGHAVASGLALLVPDAQADPRFHDNPLVTGAPHIAFYAGVPLQVDGLPVGTVCALDNRPRDDGAAVLALLETAAGLLSRLLAARLAAVRSRRAEALALATAQLNSDWTWQTDADGRLCTLDERYAAATGSDAGQRLGQPLVGAAGALLAQDAAPAIEAALRAGRPFRQLPLNWCTAGGSATLLLSGVPVHDGGGRLTGFCGTAVDPRRGLRAVARAERAEKLLVDAAEHFGGALMLADADGTIVLANSAWRTLHAGHMAPGRGWPEVLRSAVAAGEFPQAGGREALFVDACLAPEPGERPPLERLRGGRWWLTQAHRLADGTLLQVALDVTANKQAEARWRHHAELHQAVATAVSDGIVVVNQYGDVISFNPAAAQLWRRSEAEMPTLNIYSASVNRVDDRGRPLPVEDHPVRRALRSQRPIEGFRYGLERVDAPIQWFDIDVIPLGNASEAMMVFRDVSEHRAASAARSVAGAADRTPLPLGRVGEGVWQWEGRRGRLFLSPACAQMLGHGEAPLDPEDALRSLAHPEDHQQLDDALRGRLPDGGELIDLECRLRHRDGGYRWIAMRGRVNRDASGAPHEASGLLSDITSQRAALAALAEKQSAESANAAKSAFLSRVSHEIRTPLSAIVGFSRMLQRGRLADSLVGPVYRIHEAGQHLLGLVNDLLDVQRIESDSLPLSIEPVEALPLLSAMCELLGVEAETHDVQIEVEADALAGLWLAADLQRLRQVLLNLVGNAIKYGRDGQTVRLRGACSEGIVRLEVVDEGRGLSAEQLARLFQPFERLGLERSSIAGTGLGLVIARRLTEAMGGRLGVHSTPGQGSTFWVELPQAQAPAAGRATQAVAAEVETAPPRPEAVLSLLYVEDNPVNVILLESLVATLPGWSLRVATSGADARRVLEHWTPDLMVLDAHLPDTHGLQLLPALRAMRPDLAALPAVMFTADAMPQDHRDSLAAGFDRHWTKPIDVDAVLRELREMAVERNRVAA